MQVKATQRGFHFWLRHPGEVFEIAEHLFSKEWMEKIEATDDASKAAAAAPPLVDDEHVAVGSSLFSNPLKIKEAP